MKMETSVCNIGVLSNTRIQTHLNDSSPTEFTLSVLSCSVQTSLSQTANQVHGESRRRLGSTHSNPQASTLMKEKTSTAHTLIWVAGMMTDLSVKHIRLQIKRKREMERKHTNKKNDMKCKNWMGGKFGVLLFWSCWAKKIFWSETPHVVFRNKYFIDIF